MQIDFHHTATYVIARDAGFSHNEADIISYSAQYVDDAVTAGAVYFDNGAVFNRICSAHRKLDPRNTLELANHYVWLAFHFLPGNGGKGPGEDPAGSFIEKIICLPDGPVAREAVRDAILEKNRPYGLHRLGVTMHSYADSWAHQGFAGVLHKVNDVDDAEDMGNSGLFNQGGLVRFLKEVLDDAIPPVGHARAHTMPDLPFLKWRYRNGRGVTIARDNRVEFLAAAEHMCIAMRRYLLGDPDAAVPGLSDATRRQLDHLFATVLIVDGHERHQKWLEAIRAGYFTVCGPVDINDYFPQGNDSWKADALGTSFDLPVQHYQEGFLGKPWKLFHDALLANRFNVVTNILPKYGICAA